MRIARMLTVENSMREGGREGGRGREGGMEKERKPREGKQGAGRKEGWKGEEGVRRMQSQYIFDNLDNVRCHVYTGHCRFNCL